MIELAGFVKTGGPLTKRITLAPDGSLRSDGSACLMSEGHARRLRFADLHAFGRHISSLPPHEAIALGALHDDLPDQVQVTTKRALNSNADRRCGVIARTADHIAYRSGQPALALIDIDTKGMPHHVRSKIDAAGGYWAALVSVLPELQGAGCVVRSSTSAGIYRADTGERLPGSDGRHIFVLVADGSDIQRFLYRLHERCWLNGFGWSMVGRAGQLLDRSLVDRMVYAPERLVFEGAPVLEPPLAQDSVSRVPLVTPGVPLDTRAICPDLTQVEQAKLRQLRSAETRRLAPDANAALDRYVRETAQDTGCTPKLARHLVERQHKGVLLPGVALEFDDADLQGKMVADVLADPDRYTGETLADPLEGMGYGRCKAKIIRRADGSLWINSFAHGRTTYDLTYDAAGIGAALHLVPPTQTADELVRLLLMADVAPDEEERLRDLACRLTGIKARTLAAKVKVARQERDEQRARAERERRAAERTDPRPQVPAPPYNAPWLPQVGTINEVLGASTAPEPPMRDLDGVVTVVRTRSVPNLHTLTVRGANQEDTTDSRLPAPQEPLLTRLDEKQIAEMIEQHIDYYDARNDCSVHLAAPFVQHYRQRHDKVLPTVTGVATLPLVLPDGSILSGRGLNRQTWPGVPRLRRAGAAAAAFLGMHQCCYRRGDAIPGGRLAGRRGHRLCRQVHPGRAGTERHRAGTSAGAGRAAD